jgi:hypothetical protein|tara:strand:- start:419 stop:649 length:231 start_codon:yes stop_codon:yes gene_type:complete
VIKDRKSILRNEHPLLGINVACPHLEESHSLSYAEPTLPQAGIYNDKIGTTESEQNSQIRELDALFVHTSVYRITP